MTVTEVAPAEISPLKASRLTDQVYEAITARILNGTFRPGDRLDVNWLADKLEVSPTPVKNALSLLANEGLVQILPRNGTFVTQVSRRSLEEALAAIEGEGAGRRAAATAAVKALGDVLKAYPAHPRRGTLELARALALQRAGKQSEAIAALRRVAIEQTGAQT